MTFLRRIAASVTALGILAASALPASAATDPRFGIAEGFRNAGQMAELGAGFERLILPWDQIQPGGPGDFSKLGQTLRKETLQQEIARGTRIAGLFQFTPGWAAANPSDGARAVPKNLNLPFDDPNNYFGQYVFRTVSFYKDQIHDWVIWNEPEFRESDAGAGGSFTWKGTDAEFAQLMKVGYLAAKKADPSATVSFPGTSYWVEEIAKRPQFYDRALGELKKLPDAAANNFFHDAVSLNLYRAPDDIYRVYSVFKAIQQRNGVDKPIWLTETNAMPSDDTSVPCAAQQAQRAFVKTTMQQQAAYALQSFALAAAAGYERIEFYQMIDSDTCREPAVWGVTRDNGTVRPVAAALKTAMQNFAGYTRAQFVPLVRETTGVCQPSCWPDDPTGLVTNFQVYQVALDKPGNQRVTALWNGDGNTLRARIKKNGASARLVSRDGASTPLQENQGWWVADLPGATAYFYLSESFKDPDGYHYIGGDPVLIVEDGVDPATPVAAPALGDPGSVPREFRVFLNPADGQTVSLGAAADFFAATRGYEGFNDPVSVRVSQWSTQRFPDPKDATSLPLRLTFPDTVQPGQTAQIHVETAGAEGGIYFVTMELSGGGITRTVDLALVIS